MGQEGERNAEKIRWRGEKGKETWGDRVLVQKRIKVRYVRTFGFLCACSRECLGALLALQRPLLVDD